MKSLSAQILAQQFLEAAKALKAKRMKSGEWVSQPQTPTSHV